MSADLFLERTERFVDDVLHIFRVDGRFAVLDSDRNDFRDLQYIDPLVHLDRQHLQSSILLLRCFRLFDLLLVVLSVGFFDRLLDPVQLKRLQDIIGRIQLKRFDGIVVIRRGKNDHRRLLQFVDLSSQ